MRVQLPKTSGKKLEFHESEFVLALNRLKNPDAEIEDNFPVGINHHENFVEIDDEYGFTEDDVKEAYKQFKHVPGFHLNGWKKRLHELLDKDEKGDLTEEEDKELKKLERKQLKQNMEGESG